MLYTALIGYIHYEAPEEEQNFSTSLDFLNASEVREDDELQLDTLGDEKTALFLIMSDKDATFNFLISLINT